MDSSKSITEHIGMNAIEHEFWAEQADEPQVRLDSRIDPQVEDAYWQSVYWGEPYCRRDCSYEDYAPAYCVGYVGYAQYGGVFAQAEKCLCANWLRIKGDSRLGLEEAMQAVRAAWDHAAQGQLALDEEDEEPVQVRATPRRQPQYATA
jgi:hypothetical protein